MRTPHVLVAVLTLIVTAACAGPERQQQVKAEADVQAVKSSLAEWAAAANAQDPERMLTLVTDDLEWLPPGQEPVVGADAHNALRDYFDQFVLHVSHDNQEIVVGGDLAYVRYTYELNLTPKGGEEPVTLKGHGIRILRRQADGSWKQARDVWTEGT